MVVAVLVVEQELPLVCPHLQAALILTAAARVPVPVLPIHRIRKQVSPLFSVL